jgi:hypothetical protein
MLVLTLIMPLITGIFISEHAEFLDTANKEIEAGATWHYVGKQALDPTAKALPFYNYITTHSDAWSAPMVENYIEMAGLEEGEEFDVTELNQWLEEELMSLQEGYEEYLDSY